MGFHDLHLESFCNYTSFLDKYCEKETCNNKCRNFKIMWHCGTLFFLSAVNGI